MGHVRKYATLQPVQVAPLAPLSSKTNLPSKATWDAMMQRVQKIADKAEAKTNKFNQRRQKKSAAPPDPDDAFAFFKRKKRRKKKRSSRKHKSKAPSWRDLPVKKKRRKLTTTINLKQILSRLPKDVKKRRIVYTSRTSLNTILNKLGKLGKIKIDSLF